MCPFSELRVVPPTLITGAAFWLTGPHRVRRRQVEIARKESLVVFTALIQPNQVGT